MWKQAAFTIRPRPSLMAITSYRGSTLFLRRTIVFVKVHGMLDLSSFKGRKSLGRSSLRSRVS
jgi:hypothetical protein